MIIDSSAVMAALRDEPSATNVMAHLANAKSRAMGTPTLVETGMVLVSRLGPSGRTLLVRFCNELEINETPFSSAHWPIALDAFQRFGNGRHPASLSFGDCLTYATARLAQQPLLHIGNDFAQTDLALVSANEEPSG